jgi:FlaA1/EpsC-like NDP-sugar epimerase
MAVDNNKIPLSHRDHSCQTSCIYLGSLPRSVPRTSSTPFTDTSTGSNMTQTSLVTGGTGFIALWVVKLLLERSHYIPTVCSIGNKKKCKSLLDLQAQYPNKLRLFGADLLVHGSFFQAMQDCDTVYHVASPFLVPQQIKDRTKDMVEPALNGTRNVSVSVNDMDSVKRVILTYSSKSMNDICYRRLLTSVRS